VNTPQNVSICLHGVDTLCIILVMKLREYINSLPSSKRQQARERIADACNCSVSAVKHWVSGRNQIPTKHWSKIISVCDGMVQFDDLLEESVAA